MIKPFKEFIQENWDDMIQSLKAKAAQQKKLEAQGKKPVTKQDPKTGKYYVDFSGKKEVKEEVWDEPNPKKDHKSLTPAQKAKAKARAAKAGRKYPNLVDNMWAANEEVSLEEAVQYHLDNNISITENVFRPGSDMFFKLISEAKRLYAEGKYKPIDEFEKQMLESDIGEKAMYEGQEVILDFPFEEELNEEESDPTGGHGIGKPFRSGGGGAVYVRTGDGGVRKVNFSQSGMKKRYNEPGRVRSFVARHHCLTNKDKTSASYWACRWPRYFSNTGQQWW